MNLADTCDSHLTASSPIIILLLPLQPVIILFTFFPLPILTYRTAPAISDFAPLLAHLTLSSRKFLYWHNYPFGCQNQICNLSSLQTTHKFELNDQPWSCYILIRIIAYRVGFSLLIYAFECPFVRGKRTFSSIQDILVTRLKYP